MIAGVKFNNSPLEENEKKLKRQINISLQRKKKQEENEKYNNEAKELRYKRLMHLLNKSKFFSSYLINKFEDNEKTKLTKNRNKNPPVNDENVPQTKKKPRKDAEKYDMQEYISTEVSNKI